MPNLVPPVTTRRRGGRLSRPDPGRGGPGLQAADDRLSDRRRRPDELARGFAEGIWIAAKLYPAGATTNSASGVTDIRNIYPALERMQAIGMVLCVHGEVTDPDVDVFDREAVFIERILSPLVDDFPRLKIVLEHITTSEAADFVDERRPNVAATITPQHLHINRNALFAGRLRPHAYCLPVAKREAHRLAVRKAAVSVRPNSSSAPTARRMRARPRNRPAAAPAFSTRRSRSKAMRACSTASPAPAVLPVTTTTLPTTSGPVVSLKAAASGW